MRTRRRLRGRRNPPEGTLQPVIFWSAAAAITAVAGAFVLMRPRSPPSPTLSKIDSLLKEPMTENERARLLHGLELVPDRTLPSDVATRSIAGMLLTLRAMDAIQFDSPVPVINATNLLEYIKRIIKKVRITNDRQGSPSAHIENGEPVIHMPFDQTDFLDRRPAWFESDNTGIHGTVPILVHEARHFDGFPAVSRLHNCDTNGNFCETDLDCRSMGLRGGHGTVVFPPANDTTLAYGGAWAAHYYTILWLADHAPGWFSDGYRNWARTTADKIPRYQLCHDPRFVGPSHP